MTNERYRELRNMLESRRNELVAEQRLKLRAITESGTLGELRRVGDSADRSVQDENDIEFDLINMRNQTITKINVALARLERGNYGSCDECGKEIATKRLRALPSAVRCKKCQEALENAEERERQVSHGRRY